MSEIIPEVRRLIAVRRGPVPGTLTVNYDLCLDREMFGLSTIDRHGYPLWYTFGWISQSGALTVRDAAAKLKVVPSPDLPARFAWPGLLTVLLPTMIVAEVDKDDVSILADFAKTMFSVWAMKK